MATSKKANIGKGISALLGNISEEINNIQNLPNIPAIHAEKTSGSISRIPVDQISPNPKQPRKDFDANALQALSNSIKEHDVIQPITVIKIATNQYQLISGERRWRASKLAGLKDIPAYIRSADVQAQMELALIENLQREDLNAIEIALSYKALMDECNFTQEEVAERMHKERSTVANMLRLLKLPPTIQQAVREGKISGGHARTILGVVHIEQQLYVYNEVLKHELSVRATEALVATLNKSGDRSKPKEDKVKDKAPAIRRLEDALTSKFSTKVNISRNKQGKGQIVIDFFNDNDLNRLIEVLEIN
jgi:ParB family transcriptional regulator, chromosome partitioning protein